MWPLQKTMTETTWVRVNPTGDAAGIRCGRCERQQQSELTFEIGFNSTLAGKEERERERESRRQWRRLSLPTVKVVVRCVGVDVGVGVPSESDKHRLNRSN